MSSRQLHLNVNLLHSGVYASAWRLPESDPRACFDVGHYVRVAQIAERGKLDAIFLADTPAITDRIDYRSFMSLEPTIVLATVAAATSHNGLSATPPTTYNEPHNIAHRGAHYSVAGPLNVPRSPQGRPVTVQAGGSSDGRDLAAAQAEAVFTLAQTIEEGVAYARDLRTRAIAYGRAGDSIVILPGLATVIGSSEAEAKRRQDELWELVPVEYSLARLASTLEIDPA